MLRFGESLANMLNVWGYRVVVHDELRLERVTEMLKGLWNVPTEDELLLRLGMMTLVFPHYDLLRDAMKQSGMV